MMRFTSLVVLLGVVNGFVTYPTITRQQSQLFGYLDDLSNELYSEVDNPDLDREDKSKTNLNKEDLDRFGPGDWSSYADFGDEFDGGDGQMGVAGDGNKKLEKFGNDVSPQLVKSRSMSAKNAWGTSTGYADKMIKEKGMDIQRAQQLENWMNQQELLKTKNAHRAMTDNFDQVSTNTADEDWRTLAKFGVERNQEFDLDETFGAVTADEVEDVIELKANMMGQASVHELSLKNEYMGFADFRAAFTTDTPPGFTVSPSEGSLSKEPTQFLVKYKPNAPGIVEGYLVIETEDFKKTYKVIGGTA